MASKGGKESVEVDGRTVRFTHPDKVLYDATGTTKADVLEYYLAVAPHLMTYADQRPVTRKRWPDGTEDKSFFEKNLPSHAPDWVSRVAIEHSSRTVTYPVLDSPARGTCSVSTSRSRRGCAGSATNSMSASSTSVASSTWPGTHGPLLSASRRCTRASRNGRPFETGSTPRGSSSPTWLGGSAW